MLAEALAVLAATGGGAVVRAAGTDAWNGLRTSVARLLARGEAARERTELERLDRTQAALATADGGEEIERVSVAQTAVWQTRFETLLEEASEAERDRIAAELEALIDQVGGKQEAEAVHNDFRHSTFHGPVQGSGTQHNNFRA
ncbi:hypothetical protein [Streptomyces sp. NPDC001507]|uniref:hypothetical protein n=1 Tax=Streptomyces sp. NPDC001507 TaxID=3364579 RepID=UPI00367E4291